MASSPPSNELGHATTISVLDIELPGSEQATARVIAAYKRWLDTI